MIHVTDKFKDDAIIISSLAVVIVSLCIVIVITKIIKFYNNYIYRLLRKKHQH